MTALKISRELALPLDAVTQTFLVVGKRGSGKSNTAARFVEQLHHAKIPFVVLDPVDTWWGLKAARDGVGPGLGVYVFGGRRADLPLEANDGALIAQTLCEHAVPMVLSVKHLSGRQRSTFMVDFAQTLFQKWAGGPLHVVIEEAHELAPQSTMNAKEGEQQMLGAFKRLWKLGRASGIGGTAITQRPASLSKDITTQSEVLIAHRTIGPQDVKAVGEWVKYHGEHLDMLADLPSLPTGDAFVWAPEFPEGKPIGLRRVEVLLRETYDSASTPKVGERRVEPKEFASVDMERLRAKLAATIEKAKAEDPKELQKRIRELERELRAAENAERVAPGMVDHATMASQIDAAVYAEAQRHERYRRVLQQSATLASAEIATAISIITDSLREAQSHVDAIGAGIDEEWVKPIAPDPALRLVPRGPSSNDKVRADALASGHPRRGDAGSTPAGSTPQRAPSSNGAVSGTSQKIVDALAFYERAGEPRPTRAMVAAFIGATVGGSFSARLSEARSAGLIDDVDKSRVALADAGRAHVDGSTIPTSLRELHDRWLSKTTGTGRKVLELLLSIYPDSIDRAAAAAHVGATVGGSFSARLSELRGPGLLDESNGELRASPNLFPKGLR